MEAHFAKSPIRLLDLRHTDPACTQENVWVVKENPNTQPKVPGGRAPPTAEKREVARGAENVGFAGIGERHASQVGAWGGEELKSSF